MTNSDKKFKTHKVVPLKLGCQSLWIYFYEHFQVLLYGFRQASSLSSINNCNHLKSKKITHPSLVLV